ncbi:MAG: methyltransferase domain-containing protein [Parcubacteria group bacterium]|nr:methyltransferase domain-containing protein [Parcubacteria group bacterium]
MLKLCLACGARTYKDYTNIDIRPGQGDLTHDISKPLPFDDNTVDEILIESSFEHLFRAEAVESLKDWYKKLKSGGILKITRVPDFDIVIKDYQEGYFDDMLGGVSGLDIAYGAIMGAPCGPDIHQLHKNLYTKDSLEYMVKINTDFKEIEIDYCINKLSEKENEFPRDHYGLWLVATK